MKINSIQYMRAIAALLVVYTHSLCFIGGGNSYQASFYFLKDFGAIGVDLFFVISGFIITFVSVDLNGIQKGVIFLKKRFIRINPSYYFASIIALVLRYISKPQIEFPFQETIKSITILPFFDFGDKLWHPILYVGWTLAFEWFFYIIFAILIIFSVRKKQLWLILILSTLTLLGLLFPIKNIQFSFITNPLVWEFCMGVLIATTYKKINGNQWVALFTLIVGLIIYFVIIVQGYGFNLIANNENNVMYLWNRFFIWGIPSALIVFGAVFIEKMNLYSFNNEGILLIGNASYAIYLIHTMVIAFINKVFDIFNFIPLDIIVWVSIIFSTITGILYYMYIEKRLTKYFNEKILYKQNRITVML